MKFANSIFVALAVGSFACGVARHQAGFDLSVVAAGKTLVQLLVWPPRQRLVLLLLHLVDLQLLDF